MTKGLLTQWGKEKMRWGNAGDEGMIPFLRYVHVDKRPAAYDSTCASRVREGHGASGGRLLGLQATSSDLARSIARVRASCITPQRNPPLREPSVNTRFCHEENMTTSKQGFHSLPRSIVGFGPLSFLVLFVVVLAVYGFEILAFTISTDEELHAILGRQGTFSWWISEGRWSMALISLLFSVTTVPVVTQIVGICLAALSFVWIAVGLFGLRTWKAALAVSFAISIPSLIYILSFSTIAHGIGIASLLAVTGVWTIHRQGRFSRSIATTLLALSMGIYDPFLIFAGALGVIACWQLRSRVWSTGIVLLSAFAVSRVSAFLLAAASGVPSRSYTESFWNFERLFAAPGEAFTAGFDAQKFFTFEINKDFAYIVVLLGCLLLTMWSAFRADRGEHALVSIARVAIPLFLFLLPFFIQSASSILISVRSFVFYPLIALFLVSVSLEALGKLQASTARAVSISLVVLLSLSTVSNAVIVNRLSAAAQATHALDSALAREILFEVERQLGRPAGSSPLIVMVSGVKDWPVTEVRFADNTIGLSHFNTDFAPGVGERISAFLRTQGIPAQPVGRTEGKQLLETIDAMPSYPTDGWILVVDETRVLIKLDEMTVRQRSFFEAN